MITPDLITPYSLTIGFVAAFLIGVSKTGTPGVGLFACLLMLFAFRGHEMFASGAVVPLLFIFEFIRNRMGWTQVATNKPFRWGCGILAGATTILGNAAGAVSAAYFSSQGLDKKRFLGTNAVFFFLVNCLNHTLAGALRGYGDSKGPMVILLTGFVAVRQTYLYVLTHYISNTPKWVGFGYPVGWMATGVMIVIYYAVKKRKFNTSGLTL